MYGILYLKAGDSVDWFGLMKDLKENSGMTNHDIAVKSGVPEPTLEKIFSGATRKPGIGTILDIIHALGGTLDSIDPAAKKQQPAKDDGLSDAETELFTLFRELPESYKSLAASLCSAVVRELLRHRTIELEIKDAVPVGLDR